MFQNSILYRAANSVGLPSSLWGGAGGGGRELWPQTRPYSHCAKHLGRHDHLGLVPPLRRQKRTVTVANLRNLPVAFLDADRSRRLAARQRYQLAVTCNA